MSRRWKSVLGAATAAAALFSSLPAAAQNEHDMTFHTVPPCNVVDTRTTGGAFAAGEIRTYTVVGSGSLASQGGSATGCGVPGFSNGIAQVQAVALNIIAFTPTGGGNMIANAADQTLGSASVLNFTSGQNVSNTAPVAVAQASGVGDFKLQVNISSSHVLIRVFGYYSKPIQTVHVHPVPGDHTASGTALLTAMSGITNSSATKRYVLKLEPGIYDVGSTELEMKPYVDIEGSGQQSTVIQGAGNNVDDLTAVIQAAVSTELRNLQVKSTGSSHTNSIAILVPEDADLRIYDVTATASGATINWAVRNRNGNAMIEGATLNAIGGTSAYGINTKGPDTVTTIKRSVVNVSEATNSYGLGANTFGRYAEIRDVQVTVSASSGTAYGIWIADLPTSADHRLTDSTITASGGSSRYGIYSESSGTLFVEQSQVRAIGSGGTGIDHVTGDTFIDHSEIAGDGATVNALNANIGATRLQGGAASGGTCAGVYDETFTFFAGPTCP